MSVALAFDNIFVILFLVGTVGGSALEELLSFINYRSRRKKGNKVPKELYGYVDSALLKKTCAYRDELYALSVPEHFLSLLLSLVLAFSGAYVFAAHFFFVLTGSIYLTAIGFLFAVSLPPLLLSIPFDLYRVFHIEEKYGFSTITLPLWIADGVKSLLLSVLLSVPLVCIAVFLLLRVSDWWWLLLGVVYVAFSLLFSFVYPVLIAPLFNKFSPLESRDLQERLERLLVRTGFSSKGIFVMDASRRSRHSNAYFTGFGKNKRVVLYDTLLEKLSVGEVEGVLAHELGHYRLHHIAMRLMVMIPLVFAVLFALSVFVKMPSLYRGFGFTPELSAVVTDGVVEEQVLPYIWFVGIFLAGLVFGGFSLLFSLVANIFSRRHEFEADRYSGELCGTSRPLITALIKLNKENLAEVSPPKIYSLFYYSHPPLLERIKALEELDSRLQG